MHKFTNAVVYINKKQNASNSNFSAFLLQPNKQTEYKTDQQFTFY